MDHVQGTIYLICLDRPFGHARHYVGWARWLDRRIGHHARGTGSTFLRHVLGAGIGWKVVRTMPGDRFQERAIKNAGGQTRYCPRCSPRPRNGVWAPIEET